MTLVGKDSPERLLFVVIGVLLSCFLVATVIAQQMSSRVATISESLVGNALPRIKYVASLRDMTLDVQSAVAELVHSSSDEREKAKPVLDAKLLGLRQQVRLDLAREGALSKEVVEALGRFERAVERTRFAIDRDPGTARASFQMELLPAANALGDLSMQEVERSAQHGRELALQLAKTRGRIIWLSYALIAISVAVAGLGIVLMRRRSARRFAAAGEQAREADLKVKEMEQFAGRVAHDIRSPLATASLASDMLAEELASSQARSIVARLQRSLARAAAITDGLLEFARAGANPEPGARANVREVVEDITEGIRPELALSAVELDVGEIPSVYVACSTGVLLSLVGNLVRNANKYMGKRDERRISIRAIDRGSAVRIEVSDTGPGVAADLVPRLFEPYFRIVTDRQAGLGLGLPTVRKLAEGHGGSVGVESVHGHGSTFWFELPAAGGAWDPGEPSHERSVSSSDVIPSRIA